MTMIDRINQDLTLAVKAGDRLRTDVLRMLKSQIKNREIDKGDTLTEAEEIQVFNTAVKQRKESMKLYREGQREDLFEKESKEVEIIMAYLPEPLFGAALAEAIGRAIKKVDATSPKDMGIVMKTIMQEYGGRVDGREVQKLVQEELA